MTEIKLLIPAYFHPQDEPVGWRILARLGPAVTAAIMNPDSGPGPAADPRYDAPIRAVTAAGGRVIGYVDTGYGHRPASEVLRDIAVYQDWYGLTGVFLDQAACGPDELRYYTSLAEACRVDGLEFIALNPGVIPEPGYAQIADLIVTFEGPWMTYREHRAAPWMRDLPADRFGNLVHGAPTGALTSRLVGGPDRHAAVVYATELTGANPWARLCQALQPVRALRL